jgi:hypothetical protein
LARFQAFQWKLEKYNAKAEGRARGRLNQEEAFKQLKQTGDFIGAYQAAWAIYDDAMAAKQEVSSILSAPSHYEENYRSLITPGEVEGVSMIYPLMPDDKKKFNL